MIAGIAAGVFAGYRYLLPAAVPFLAAWLLAAWLYPLTQKIERKTGIRKSLSGTFLMAAIFLALGFLLYAGARELFAQIRTAVSHYPVFLRWGSRLLDRCCGMIEEISGIEARRSRMYIQERLEEMGGRLLSSAEPLSVMKALSCVRGALLAVSGVIVTFIAGLLILGDLEELQKKIWDYPLLVGTRRVVRRLRKTTAVYLKAQLIIMSLVAVVCGAGFWLLKSPYFLIFGIALGIFDALPMIGTGIFLYPAAVIFLVRGKALTALGCVAIDVAASLVRELLESRLLGGKLGVSPIVILVSVYGGVLLYGGWGVILGPLSLSTVYEIGKEWDVWD